MHWTAIVLAGSRPGADPFAAAHGTDLKALIPVAGKPMVRRPVEALLASGRIAAIRVFAQQPGRIAPALPVDGRLSVEASGATIAETLEALCLDSAVAWPLLVTTADHALLDGGMIDEFCDRAEGADIAIGVVEQRVMRERFADSQRTWIRFRGGAYSGANLFALRSPRVLPALELWRLVEQDRKRAWRLLWLMGPISFLAAALRLRTLDRTLDHVGSRFGLTVRAVPLSNPLAAIDVDKPADLRLVEAIVEDRA